MYFSKPAAIALLAHAGLFWAGVIVNVHSWRMLWFVLLVGGFGYLIWWRYDSADRVRSS